MMILGETADGCKIIRSCGGITHVETIEERDNRRAQDAQDRIERTANELLSALERLIPTSAHGPARDQAETAVAKARGTK